MRSGWRGLLLATAVMVAPGEAIAGASISLGFRQVELHTETEGVDRLEALFWRGGLELRSEDPRFGGLSALDISDDGAAMLGLTDRGYWIRARLGYDREGRLSRVGPALIGPLTILQGRSTRRLTDSEALARSTRGIVVAFEGRHRLVEFGLDSAGHPVRGHRLVSPNGLSRLSVNAGIEALARLGDGRLLAIAEGQETMSGAARAWLGKPPAWSRAQFAVGGRFRPTGAAPAPDGGLLVLERRFSWIGGVAARIKKVALDDIVPDRPIRGTVLATLETPFINENFEGIAARRGSAGETLIYVVSDDNFLALQRTLLLLFALPAGSPR